jgi:hypothetical protein
MSNRHIKVINGRKYYYESIRKGKKVTSKYLGPVERIRKRKRTASEAPMEQLEAAAEQQEPQEEDTAYIG